jgi:hypothetical protein
MLVDLARNDVNRVCDPLTTRVDRLMVVQKVRSSCGPIAIAVQTCGPIDGADPRSSPTSSIWSPRSRACSGQARRDSMRSGPFFQLVGLPMHERGILLIDQAR